MRRRERPAPGRASSPLARYITGCVALTVLLGACGDDEAAESAVATAVPTSAEAEDAATTPTAADTTVDSSADTTILGTTAPESALPPAGGSADPVIDVELAAATVADIIRIGVEGGPEPGPCPYGPTADLAALLPKDAVLAAPLRAGDVDDDGQLWSGAQPNLIYCPISAADHSVEWPEIEEFRVDVAAGEADVIDYLDQNFETVDPDKLVPGADLLGGESVGVCHDDGCTAAWTGGELFVAVTLIGTQETKPTLDQAWAALVPMVPLVVERLTALGELLGEIDALARSNWDGVYDDEIWAQWEKTVQSGDREQFAAWLDYEVDEAATITREQSDALFALLDRLP